MLFLSNSMLLLMLFTTAMRISNLILSINLGSFTGCMSSLSLKQYVIADSSTVAAFIGSHIACQQIAWVQNLLHETDIVLTQPATLYQDNMSTIKIHHHKGNVARIKNITLRYNII